MRLNRYIATCGVCSRRAADKLIEDKRITVNGKIAEFGTEVNEIQYFLTEKRSRLPKKALFLLITSLLVLFVPKKTSMQQKLS